MAAYKYAAIMHDSGGVYLICTDSKESEWILKELKTVVEYRLQTQKTEKLISGEAYYYIIDQLKGGDSDVKWWIIQQICLRGWEPLGPTLFEGGKVWHYFKYSSPA